MCIVADENRSDVVLFQYAPFTSGIAIPYPSIALHATMKYKSQVEALYMNISLNDAETVNADEDIEVLELTVLPPNYPSDPQTAAIKDIFTAMNTCADMHPDPNDSDEGPEVDDTAPGATGWITADNMDEYVDEEGNFRGPVYGEVKEEESYGEIKSEELTDDVKREEIDGEIKQEEPLGPGAGSVRAREDEDVKPNGVNGADGETKWQRTG